MHEVPDEYLRDALPLAKKIAIAQGTPNYNILQNNGRLAHQVSTYTEVWSTYWITPRSLQEVPHVHFHIIPKPEDAPQEGLGIGWPAKTIPKEELQKIHADLKVKLDASPESAL